MCATAMHDQQRNDTIRKLTFLLNQIELKINQTIKETGRAYKNTISEFLMLSKLRIRKTIQLKSHTETILIEVIRARLFFTLL